MRRHRERLAPLILGEPSKGRLKELPGNPEGEVALELGTSGLKHCRSRFSRQIAPRAQQLGLADPRGPLDQEDAAGPHNRPLDQTAKLLELPFTLEQARSSGHLSHARHLTAGVARQRRSR